MASIRAEGDERKRTDANAPETNKTTTKTNPKSNRLKEYFQQPPKLRRSHHQTNQTNLDHTTPNQMLKSKSDRVLLGETGQVNRQFSYYQAKGGVNGNIRRSRDCSHRVA